MGRLILRSSSVVDTTPDAFTFTDQTSVSLSSTITSAAITVTGINAAATISVTGGTYDINASGSFTSSSGSVNNGDTVRARHTSSGSNSTAVNTVVTIGGVSDTFTSTTVSSGSLTDGGAKTITGTGWGTNSITQEFMGGTGGHLDTSTPGNDFSKSGWTTVSGIYAPKYSTAQTLSRARSLAFDAAFHKAANPSNSAAFGICYDNGGPIVQQMWTSNIYYGVNASASLTGSQQKFYRLMPTADVLDTQPQRYFTHWRQANIEGDGDANANPNNTSGGGGSGYVGGTVYLHPTNGPNASRHPNTFPNNNTGQWYQIRLWQALASGTSVADGQWKLHMTRLSDGAVMMDDLDFGILDFIDAGRVRQFVMQHYFGNAAPATGTPGTANGTTNFEEPADGYCYEDDCYLTLGTDTQKFLLLGNASTYSACTKFATQPFTSWTNTQIDFTANKGALTTFTTGNVWAYPMSSIKTPFSNTGIAL